MSWRLSGGWAGRRAYSEGADGPGWLVGGGQRSVRDLVALIAFAVCAQLLITSLNDVYDAARDAVTAPYLPIPSGAISRRGALVVPAVCGLALLILLAVLASIRESPSSEPARRGEDIEPNDSSKLKPPDASMASRTSSQSVTRLPHGTLLSSSIALDKRSISPENSLTD